MDLEGLWTPRERAAHYRRMAKQALEWAKSSSLPPQRQEFEALAAQWIELAEEVEQAGDQTTKA